MSDHGGLYELVCAVLVGAIGAVALYFLAKRLAAARPGLSLVGPVMAAFGLRVLLTAALAALQATASDIRGPDDILFQRRASALASLPPWNGTWVDRSFGRLPEVILGAVSKVLRHPGDVPLRLVLAAIAAAGIALLASACFDLAGRGAAVIAAWLLALEPSNVFFSTLLHEESLLMLGEGAAVLGAARLWLRGDAKSVLLTAGGVGVVAATRPYAGFFVLVGAVLVAVHVGVREARSRLGPGRLRAALPVVAVLGLLTVAAAAVPTPPVQHQLHRLQNYQDKTLERHARLTLEPIDYLSVGGVAEGLPHRIWDLAVRPYPWEHATARQRVGGPGTALVWLLLIALVTGLLTCGGERRRNVLPVAYVLAPVVVGYALSTVNAGTGFRHRTQIVFLLVAMVSVVWGDRAASVSLPRGRIPVPLARRSVR